MERKARERRWTPHKNKRMVKEILRDSKGPRECRRTHKDKRMVKEIRRDSKRFQGPKVDARALC